MANVKGNALPAKTSVALTDIIIVVDPATGIAYRTTVTEFITSIRLPVTHFDDATDPYDSPGLQDEYPDSKPGDEVICDNLTEVGPTLYKKVTETIWRGIQMTPLE